MICEKIEDLAGREVAYGSVILEALNFIRSCNFSDMDNGRYELRGDAMYATIFEGVTSPRDQLKAESHFDYTDIHYIISGEERIGYAPWNEKQAVFKDLREQDALLYEQVIDECFLPLSAGAFAVFFPQEIHRPWCSASEPAPLRKMVVKIRSDLLFVRNEGMMP